MSMSRRETFAYAASLPALGLLGLAARAADDRPGSTHSKDPQLAACLLIGGTRQIEICKAAKGYVTTEQAKNFAQAEIEEHEKVAEKLKALGFEAPTFSKANVVGRDADGRAATAKRDLVTVGKFPLEPGASDAATFSYEVSQECVANFKKAMSKKEGIKLDKAFIGGQKHAHMGLLDEVTVAKRHASEAMQPILDEALSVINQHIGSLEKIMDELDQMRG